MIDISKLVRISDKTYDLIKQMKYKDQPIGEFIGMHINSLENFVTYQYFMELKPFQQKQIREHIFRVKFDSKLKINCHKIEE